MKLETFLFGALLAYMNIAMGVDVLMAHTPVIRLHDAAFGVPRWIGWPIMFSGECILIMVVWAFFKKHAHGIRTQRTGACSAAEQRTEQRTEQRGMPISGVELCGALVAGLAFIGKGLALAFTDFSQSGLGPQPFPAPQSIGWPTALLGLCLFGGGLYAYIRTAMDEPAP